MSTISDGTTTWTPSLVLGWESTRASRTVAHTVIGRADPVVIQRPAALRSGTLSILLDDITDALALEAAHAEPATFTLDLSDLTGPPIPGGADGPHSVYGATAPWSEPGATFATYSLSPDADLLATQFTVTQDGQVTKARYFAEPGGLGVGKPATLGVIVPTGSTAPSYSALPSTWTRNATVAALAAGWNEVTFGSPVAVAAGDRFWVVAWETHSTNLWQISGLSEAPPATAVQAVDGAPLYIVADPQGTAPTRRSIHSFNHWDLGETTETVTRSTGLDVVVSYTGGDETPGEPLAPTSLRYVVTGPVGLRAVGDDLTRWQFNVDYSEVPDA